MTSTKPEKKTRSKKTSQRELTEDEQRELREREKQIRERRAETQLDLARLFLTNQMPDIARRRLANVVAEFDETAAANEARTLIREL